MRPGEPPLEPTSGLALIIILGSLLCVMSAGPSALGALVFTEQERILVLAPHPDDEILGCAGVLQQAVARGLPLRVVFLTNGDFNERSFAVYRKHPVIEPRAVLEMGRIRRDEALAAARILQIPSNSVVFLGYPDFGTLQIWEAHWGARPPFESYLTRQTHVPYQHALHFGAPHKGESILSDLTEEIRTFRPTKIFVSHPADHHPDHRALFLYTQVALWNLGVQPEVFPYLVHHARWPVPQGAHLELPLNPPDDLFEVLQWSRNPLEAQAVARKREALEAHKTQFEYSADALLSFVRTDELFGSIPPIVAASQDFIVLGGDTGSLETNVPNELLETEQARFVSVAIPTIRREPAALEIKLEVSRWHPDAEVSLFVFPYRTGTEFAQMPKLHLKLKAGAHWLLDQARVLPEETLELDRAGRTTTVRIPIGLLGRAEKLLCAAQSQFGAVPLDWTPWRMIELGQ